MLQVWLTINVHLTCPHREDTTCSQTAPTLMVRTGNRQEVRWLYVCFCAWCVCCGHIISNFANRAQPTWRFSRRGRRWRSTKIAAAGLRTYAASAVMAPPAASCSATTRPLQQDTSFSSLSGDDAKAIALEIKGQLPPITGSFTKKFQFKLVMYLLARLPVSARDTRFAA